MPRKRMIDPGIWLSEQIGSLTREQRLLFIGMFSNADDEGRLKGSSKFLKATIFPYDEDITSSDIREWRDAIAQATDGNGEAPIRVYTVNGIDYIWLVNWKKYQKIDRPSPSILPPYEEGSETIRRSFDERSSSVRSEENRKEIKEENITAFADDSTNPISLQVRDVWLYYKEKIQPKAQVCPDAKIKTRLKRFSVDDLKYAIDRFSSNYWWMTKNAKQGGEWFFKSDGQIDRFMLIESQTKSEYEAIQAKSSGNNRYQPEPNRPPPVSEVCKW